MVLLGTLSPSLSIDARPTACVSWIQTAQDETFIILWAANSHQRYATASACVSPAPQRVLASPLKKKKKKLTRAELHDERKRIRTTERGCNPNTEITPTVLSRCKTHICNRWATLRHRRGANLPETEGETPRGRARAENIETDGSATRRTMLGEEVPSFGM